MAVISGVQLQYRLDSPLISDHMVQLAAHIIVTLPKCQNYVESGDGTRRSYEDPASILLKERGLSHHAANGLLSIARMLVEYVEGTIIVDEKDQPYGPTGSSSSYAFHTEHKERLVIAEALDMYEKWAMDRILRWQVHYNDTYERRDSYNRFNAKFLEPFQEKEETLS